MSNSSDIERRVFPADGLRIETRAAGRARLFGHAAVFNQRSQDLGGFREQLAPGAFAEAIKSDDVRALFNHDANIVLGRNRSGTLHLSEDSTGLAVEIDLPNTQTVRDLVVAPIERGDISQMSFGFSVRAGDQKWAKDDGGGVLRTITKASLFDVSPVTFPAYPQTDVAVRELRAWQAGWPSADKQITNARDLEHVLREAGLSKAAAHKVASGGWPALAGPEITDAAASLATRIAAATERLNALGNKPATRIAPPMLSGERLKFLRETLAGYHFEKR